MFSAGLAVVVVLFVAGCGPSAAPGSGADQSAGQLAPQLTVTTGIPTALPTTRPAETPVDATVQPATAIADAGAIQDGRPLIARVNGQPIFLDVYEKQVEQTEKALAEQGIVAQGAESETQRAQVRENVLNGLIEQAIIEQAAAGMGITVTDQELEQSLQAIVGQGQGSLEDWLAANAMTLEELRVMQRAQMLAGKVIAAVSASVPTAADQVHARHILSADIARAQAIAERLTEGENFAAVAQQESEDQSTAANGGDLGWFPKDTPMMPPAVIEAAFTLQPGEISPVVQSEIGYHVIKVEAREANRPLSPEMLLYAQQRAFEVWLAQQRAQARIERYQDQ
jgi:peptidyl-prolyl cis-trans isomerase C